MSLDTFEKIAAELHEACASAGVRAEDMDKIEVRLPEAAWNALVQETETMRRYPQHPALLPDVLHYQGVRFMRVRRVLSGWGPWP